MAGRPGGGIAGGLARAAGALALAGCLAVGRTFPLESVAEIRLGETTREEVRSTFGEPWRTGLEDGLQTWTYGHYRLALFGGVRSRDLVVRFDAQGLVASYTFNVSPPEPGAP